MDGPTDDAPGRFARRLVDTLDRIGDGRGRPAGWLTGGYLHGSAALGGWHPAVSDVDLLVVVSSWPAEAAQTFDDALAVLLPECPGRGLECSVVDRQAAAAPAAPWPFRLHVDSTDGTVRRVEGSTLPGDPDLLLHYAVARRHGRAVCGPPAAEVFGPVPRQSVLSALHDELTWAIEHAAAPYVVLNALRAKAYAQDDALLSKLEAGRRALARDPHSDTVRRAVSAQQGELPPQPPTDDDIGLARRAQAALEKARRT